MAMNPLAEYFPRNQVRFARSLALAIIVSANLFMATPSFANHPPTWIGWSSIKITASGFDFGGETFLAGGLPDAARLSWNLSNGQIHPVLDGYLHLNNVRELCARIRIDYYGGPILLSSDYGQQVCAPDGKHYVAHVNRDVYASTKINQIRVSIEKLTATKEWTTVGSQTITLGPIEDRVKITKDGFDFGGDTFLVGAPTNSGVVTWVRSEGRVTPRLVGTLHINNAASVCARMRIAYLSATATLLADEFGGTVCAPDNHHHSWAVDLAPFGHHELVSITIHLETQGTDGMWRTVGTAESQYAMYPPSLCGDPHLSCARGGRLKKYFSPPDREVK